MSTSLKVVRMAAVCCASTSRRATVRRSGDIGTTRSRAPSIAGRAGGASTGSGARAAGSGALVSARACSVRSTSCFEIRPPRPLPFTSSAASPLSAIAFRAEGAALTVPPLVVDADADADVGVDVDVDVDVDADAPI